LSYTWEFGKQFAVEFGNYPENQQDKILDFTDIYEEFGLSDFSKYQGKISPSWRGIEKTDPIYDFTYSNNFGIIILVFLNTLKANITTI
jgi:hypothetical protein